MLKRLLLALIVVALGCGPACAGASVQPSRTTITSADFDNRVADARRTTVADPKAGLIKAREIVALAERQPPGARQQELVATGLWLEGEALTRINQTAEAHIVLQRAALITSRNNKPTKLAGDVALALGHLARLEVNVGQALRSYQRAYDIFRTVGNPRGQSMALQGIGTIYDWARDYPREISYYKQALQVYSDDPVIQLSVANNLGFALRQMGRNEEALKQHEHALANAKSLHSPYLSARVLTNIAADQVKLGRYRLARASADRALSLLGQSDSWTPFVWGVKASIEFELERPEAAVADLENAFRGVDLTTTTAPFKEFHELAYKVYRATGKYSLALAHLEAFKRLEDQGHALTASANLALMAARFDFANQKLEIELLKTEQLQREAKLRESHVTVQRQAFLSLISLALVFIIWMLRRHNLLRQHRDEISKANIELKKTVDERDQEISRRVETEAHLRDAMEAAEQANRAKTKFLANMSHELRTPLNAIIGFSELISTGAMPTAKAQEYSADINASGRKLLSILGDILDTARLDAGAVSLSEGEVVLSQCIELALAKVRGQTDLSKKHISVTGDATVRVRADVQRLVQVIEKLVANAAKFTLAEGRIDIEYHRAPAGGIDLTVADDGVGIASDQLENIMERFGQVESAYTRSYGGIGLGLPIAKSLITLHGGTLTIGSEVDRGTVVRVHLPAERELPAQPGTATAAA